MKLRKLIYGLLALLISHNFSCFTGGISGKKDSMSDRRSVVTNSDSTQNSNLKQRMDSSSNKFTDLNRDAFKLHYDAIVVDTHNDILMPIKLQNADITRNNPQTQSDFVKWKKGGLDVQVFSIYVPERYKSFHYRYAMKLIDELEYYSQNYPDNFRLAANYEELIKGLEQGKFCGLMGGEGGSMIEGSIKKLETLYNRGVRYLGLTWNTSNAIAVSARDETEKGRPGGLTEFGIKVIEKMDELGMMIDVSHLGETAFWDVVNLSKNPVIASHSCVYGLCPHYRNLNDEQIKAIAKSGGIICINFYCKFLDPSGGSNQVQTIHDKYKKDLKPIEDEFGDDLIRFNDARYNYLKENHSESGTPVDILMDHIDYIVNLVGVDYVGLGSDFDGGVYSPNEIYDATCYPVITKKLVERGYKEEDIRKILGLNFLRVFRQVCG